MSPPDPSTARARDGFVDVLRAAALVRVLLWHATAWAFLSWIAAMPVMFLVGGLLAGRSVARHRGVVPVVRARVRRLAGPYVAFAVVAWSVMVATAVLKDWPEGTFAPWHPLTWVVPVVDPRGSIWGAALWAPLWYLRTYIWLLLATVALAPAARRSPAAVVAATAAAFAVSEALAATVAWWPAEVRDLFRYGPCWAAGLVVAFHGWGSRRAAGVALGVGAAVAVAAAALAGEVVLNRVPVAEVAAGAALVGAARLGRAQLGALVEGRLGPLVRRLGAHSLTIYLWHSVGWLAERELVPASWPAPVHDGLRVAAIGVVVVLAVATAGRLERRAGPAVAGPTPAPARSRPRHARRRVPRLRPAHRPVAVAPLAATALAAVLLATVVTDTPAVAGLAPQSGRFVDEQAARFRLGLAPPPAVADRSPLRAGELDQALDDWWEEVGWEGVAVVVRRPDGSAWSAGRGRWRGGDLLPQDHPMGADAAFGWGSMTKPVTAALVLRQAHLGRLGLDDPVAVVDPDVPHADVVTPRHLLGHRSGFEDTQLPRDEAIARAASRPLAFEPGQDHRYADVNYHVLDRLLERLDGRSFAEQAEEWLAAVVGPDRVVLDPRGGRGAAGGLLGDLHAAAEVLGALAAGDALDPRSWDEATTLDAGSSYGLGLTGGCPCWVDDAGRVRARSYGHPGWHSYAMVRPDDELAVAVLGTAGTGDSYPGFVGLADRLADLAAGRALPPG